MDRRGQSALFDAFLFLMIATVASAAILAYSAASSSRDSTFEREHGLTYAEDVGLAILRTTLEDPWYRNRTGVRVDLGPGVTVERFLLEEAALLSSGLDIENFGTTNQVILGIADGLAQPPFETGLEVEFRGGTRSGVLWLGGGDGPPAERFTASWTYSLGTDTQVEIRAHVWFD